MKPFFLSGDRLLYFGYLTGFNYSLHTNASIKIGEMPFSKLREREANLYFLPFHRYTRLRTLFSKQLSFYQNIY